MPLNGQKNFNVNVDEKVADEFSEHVDKNGYTKYRAVEGALRAFMAIPSEAQVALMSNSDNPKDILVSAFGDISLEKGLKELTSAQRAQILALAKEAAKTLSRKK